MYERFTDRARRVMQLAVQEAQRLNHEYIGTEHVLLGLIKEGEGVAAHVLNALGVDLAKARQETDKVVQHDPIVDGVTGPLFETPYLMKVIRYAHDEAEGLSNKYVGTEHLLLALTRETEGVAAGVLIALGVPLATVRDEVLTLLTGNPP